MSDVRTKITEDMSVDGHLELMWCDDGDIIVTVREASAEGATMASVEFCNSGGHSPTTLAALRALFRAMQQDGGSTTITQQGSAK